MVYRILLPLLGCILIAWGALRRDWLVGAAWLGVDFLALGIAHALGAHRLLGKRSDGTISIWGWLLFLPLLVYTSLVWHLARLVVREPAVNAVSDDLILGRRLLPSEVPGDFDNIVDLTAEFAEPAAIRRSPGYLCIPILDGSAPTPDVLRAAVGSLKPGRTFVHCAQGHGRTGLFALALLLNRGAAASVEDGLRTLQAIRPGIRLNRAQMDCVRQFAAGLA